MELNCVLNFDLNELDIRDIITILNGTIIGDGAYIKPIQFELKEKSNKLIITVSTIVSPAIINYYDNQKEIGE